MSFGWRASGSTALISFTQAIEAVGDTDTGVMDALLSVLRRSNSGNIVISDRRASTFRVK